ncbi:MAG: alpha/beta hydrolase [Actinomycetota bacterium]
MNDRPFTERPGTAAPETLLARRRAAPPPTEPLVSLGGTPTLVIGSPDALRTIFYLHGGAFRGGSAGTSEPFLRQLAEAAGSRIIAPDYRLAPEHPFPAALNDALAAYSAFERGPGPVILLGDSAGGGLVASLLLVLVERGTAPDAAILFSPWLDLRLENGSIEENAETEQLFPPASARDAAQMYLAGHPADDPRVSPILGDWTGAPPLHVQASATEILRDDARALVAEARRRGVLVDAVEADDERHVWQVDFPATEASRVAIQRVVEFLDRLGSTSPTE